MNDVQERLLSATKFPWFLQPGTSWTVSEATRDLEEWADGVQLCHTFVYDGSVNSAFTQPVLDLMRWDLILAACGADEKISRMKANLQLQDLGIEHNRPHIDLEGPHTVLLYYVNDSDGDTILFDRSFGEPMDRSARVVQREAPKAGDFIVFDGRYYHASSPPKASRRRAVINFTLLK